MKSAKINIVVTGSQDEGNSRKQLSYPHGVVVDQSDTVYVTDDGNGRLEQSNQLNGPVSLSFDQHGNHYVVDYGSNRVQKSNIDSNA